MRKFLLDWLFGALALLAFVTIFAASFVVPFVVIETFGSAWGWAVVPYEIALWSFVWAVTE